MGGNGVAVPAVQLRLVEGIRRSTLFDRFGPWVGGDGRCLRVVAPGLGERRLLALLLGGPCGCTPPHHHHGPHQHHHSADGRQEHCPSRVEGRRPCYLAVVEFRPAPTHTGQVPLSTSGAPTPATSVFSHWSHLTLAVAYCYPFWCV